MYMLCLWCICYICDVVYMLYFEGSFPCMLADAITGHKSEGATLAGPTIVDVRNAFTPGLLYVMLSRVTTRDNVRIVRGLAVKDFTSVSVALPKRPQPASPIA